MSSTKYFHHSEFHPRLEDIHPTALNWVDLQLAKHDLAPIDKLESVHDMAWSMVAKVIHEQGVWYFKALTPHIAYELDVTIKLATAYPEDLGKVIAHDTEKRYLLVEDLGSNLFDYSPQSEAFGLWQKALANYAQLQKRVATLGLTEFSGLPNRTLEALPEEVLPIIERCIGITPREGEAPVTLDDVEWIKRFFESWSEIVKEINELPIPNSIHHGDLHGGNIAVLDKPVVFDWGDSSWSHPFVTFYVSADACLNHFGLVDEDSNDALQEAYLTPWLEYGSLSQLKSTLEKVNRISPLVMLLSWAYAISNKADPRALEWESGLCTWVNEFLKLNRH
jgi:hypothetical protein